MCDNIPIYMHEHTRGVKETQVIQNNIVNDSKMKTNGLMFISFWRKVGQLMW